MKKYCDECDTIYSENMVWCPVDNIPLVIELTEEECHSQMDTYTMMKAILF